MFHRIPESLQTSIQKFFKIVEYRKPLLMLFKSSQLFAVESKVTRGLIFHCWHKRFSKGNLIVHTLTDPILGTKIELLTIE